LWYRDLPAAFKFFYDDLGFSIPDFKRSMDLPGVGMVRISATTTSKIQTPFYNGWMGIAPYQALPTDMQPFLS